MRAQDHTDKKCTSWYYHGNHANFWNERRWVMHTQYSKRNVCRY